MSFHGYLTYKVNRECGCMPASNPIDQKVAQLVRGVCVHQRGVEGNMKEFIRLQNIFVKKLQK